MRCCNRLMSNPSLLEAIPCPSQRRDASYFPKQGSGLNIIPGICGAGSRPRVPETWNERNACGEAFCRRRYWMTAYFRFLAPSSYLCRCRVLVKIRTPQEVRPITLHGDATELKMGLRLLPTDKRRLLRCRHPQFRLT